MFKEWAFKIAFWLFIFTRPTHDSMLAVLALVVADLIAGIWAAKKRGEKITSYGLRRTASKVLAYEMVVLCSWIVEQQFVPGIPLMKAMAGFCAIAELKSVTERLGEITGLDFWNALKERIQPLVKPPTEKTKDDGQ